MKFFGATLLLVASSAAADQSEWIGRLSHAGFKTRAHCTAAIVEGGHIVTAAHCLPKVATDTVTIALGYDRGKAERMIRAPGTEFHRDSVQDWAILCDTGAGPGLPVADSLPDHGAPVNLAGYMAPRVHVLQLRSCEVGAGDSEALAINCPSPPGASGGPVLVKDGEVEALAGVVSAGSARQTVAIAIRPADIAKACSSGPSP